MPSEEYFKQRLEELEPGVRSRASPPNICFKRKWCESNIEGAPGCDSPWHCLVIGTSTLPTISGFNVAPAHGFPVEARLPVLRLFVPVLRLFVFVHCEAAAVSQYTATVAAAAAGP